MSARFGTAIDLLLSFDSGNLSLELLFLLYKGPLRLTLSCNHSLLSLKLLLQTSR